MLNHRLYRRWVRWIECWAGFEIYKDYCTKLIEKRIHKNILAQIYGLPVLPGGCHFLENVTYWNIWNLTDLYTGHVMHISISRYNAKLLNAITLLISIRFQFPFLSSLFNFTQLTFSYDIHFKVIKCSHMGNCVE